MWRLLQQCCFSPDSNGKVANDGEACETLHVPGAENSFLQKSRTSSIPETASEKCPVPQPDHASVVRLCVSNVSELLQSHTPQLVLLLSSVKKFAHVDLQASSYLDIPLRYQDIPVHQAAAAAAAAGAPAAPAAATAESQEDGPRCLRAHPIWANKPAGLAWRLSDLTQAAGALIDLAHSDPTFMRCLSEVALPMIAPRGTPSQQCFKTFTPCSASVSRYGASINVNGMHLIDPSDGSLSPALVLELEAFDVDQSYHLPHDMIQFHLPATRLEGLSSTAVSDQRVSHAVVHVSHVTPAASKQPASHVVLGSCQAASPARAMAEKDQVLMRSQAMLCAIPCIATLMDLDIDFQGEAPTFSTADQPQPRGQVLLQNSFSIAYWGALPLAKNHPVAWQMLSTLLGSADMDDMLRELRRLMRQQQQSQNQNQGQMSPGPSAWTKVVKVPRSYQSVSRRLHQQLAPTTHLDQAEAQGTAAAHAAPAHGEAAPERMRSGSEEGHGEVEPSGSSIINAASSRPSEPSSSPDMTSPHEHALALDKIRASSGRPALAAISHCFELKQQQRQRGTGTTSILPSISGTSRRGMHSFSFGDDERARQQLLATIGKAPSFPLKSSICRDVGLAVCPSNRVMSLLATMDVPARAGSMLPEDIVSPAVLLTGKNQSSRSERQHSLLKVNRRSSSEHSRQEVPSDKDGINQAPRSCDRAGTLTSPLPGIQEGASLPDAPAEALPAQDPEAEQLMLLGNERRSDECAPLEEEVGAGAGAESEAGAAAGVEAGRHDSRHGFAAQALRDIPTDDGQQLWHEIQILPVEDPVTGKQMVMLLQMDITARALMESRIATLTETQLTLLENMFPRHVLEFMCTSSPTANIGSLACKHDQVSVLFLDIVGFTSMSDGVSPDLVMEYINKLFGRFDELCSAYNVYKLDTAGDSYICCCALMTCDQDGFITTDTHSDPYQGAVKLVEYAQAVLRHAYTVDMPNGKPTNLRVGVHTGSVVSGLTGTKLLKFSLYGDTMNTGSRMESTSKPGCIHISATTYTMLDDETKALFEPTGGVEIKGKGCMLTYMYAPAEAELQLRPEDLQVIEEVEEEVEAGGDLGAEAGAGHKDDYVPACTHSNMQEADGDGCLRGVAQISTKPPPSPLSSPASVPASPAARLSRLSTYAKLHSSAEGLGVAVPSWLSQKLVNDGLHVMGEPSHNSSPQPSKFSRSTSGVLPSMASPGAAAVSIMNTNFHRHSLESFAQQPSAHSSRRNPQNHSKRAAAGFATGDAAPAAVSRSSSVLGQVPEEMDVMPSGTRASKVSSRGLRSTDHKQNSVLLMQQILQLMGSVNDENNPPATSAQPA